MLLITLELVVVLIFKIKAKIPEAIQTKLRS